MVVGRTNIIIEERTRSVLDTYVMPDEVFLNSQVVAMAVLAIASSYSHEIRIIRTRDWRKIRENSYSTMIDIGGEEFDSQKTNFDERRDTGELYSCLGLIWRKYGKAAIRKVKYIENKKVVSAIAQKIDWEIILPIDLEAQGMYNGQHAFSFISRFLPPWTETRNPDFEEAFDKALEVTMKVLKAIISDEISKALSEQKVAKILDSAKDGIVTLPSYRIPWKEAVIKYNETHDEKIDFVVYELPGEDEEWWEGHAVPMGMDNNEYRILFPEDWPAASKTEDLPDLLDNEGMAYCHQNRIKVMAYEEEDVIKLCQFARAAISK